MRRIQLLAALCFLLPSHSAEAKDRDKKAFPFAERLGVAVQTSTATCLYIHNAKLSVGGRLTLVLLAPPQSTAKAKIVGPSSGKCPSIDESDAKLKSYEIQAIGNSLSSSTPVIAVSGFSGRVSKRGNYVTADVDGAGTPEFFRSCASSEGLHLTVWSGGLFHGKARWHQYYNLGYDVDADCTPQDIENARP